MSDRLVTYDEAPVCKRQHMKPCGDCPWRRKSLRGWLGGQEVSDWLAEAHGDAVMLCHAFKGPQCAGAAIYRRNMCKSPRHPDALVLPVDREHVFATPMEFAEHHGKLPPAPRPHREK